MALLGRAPATPRPPRGYLAGRGGSQHWCQLASQQQATQNRGGPATCSARARLADAELERRTLRAQELEALLQRSVREPLRSHSSSSGSSSSSRRSRLEAEQQPDANSAVNAPPASRKGGAKRTLGRASALAGRVFVAGAPPAAALSQLQPSGQELIELLTLLQKRKEPGRAVQVLDWVLEQPRFQATWPQFCSHTIDLLGKTPGGARQAAEIAARMRADGIPLDLVSYNTIISMHSKARKWQAVLDTLADMRAAGVRPDVFTYSSLIKACQSCGNRWRQAQEFLEEMKAAGVRPNVVTYTTLVSCCQRAGRWRQALAAFREMEQAGLRADVKAYNSLISACAKGGRWENAWEVVAGMRRAGMRPSARSHNALISACERARQPQRALEAFHRMLRDAEAADARPDQQPTLVTFNTLISACAKGGLLDEMEALLGDMEVRGLRPDAFTLSSLIRGCKQLNRWERALELVGELEACHGVRLNTIACNALLAALGRAGRWQYALQYFERLEAGELDGRPDSWSYAATAMALRAGGQHARVWALYGRMRASGQPVYKDVYPATLEACERLGLWKEGRQVLRDLAADPVARGVLDSGMDVAWQAVFAFPPLMESVPRPIISAARAAVDSGKRARRLVTAKRERHGHGDSDEGEPE